MESAGNIRPGHCFERRAGPVVPDKLVRCTRCSCSIHERAGCGCGESDLFFRDENMFCDCHRAAGQLRSNRIEGLREEGAVSHKQHMAGGNVGRPSCVENAPRRVCFFKDANINPWCRARRVEQKVAVVRKELGKQMVVRFRAGMSDFFGDAAIRRNAE